MIINSVNYNNISIFVFIIINIVSVVISKLSIFHIEYNITHYQPFTSFTKIFYPIKFT